MDLQANLQRLKSLETPVGVIDIDLAVPFADEQFDVAGTALGGWLGPAGVAQVWVRFNDRSEPLIPFRQGMILEVPYRRLFVTNLVALPGERMYLLHGDREYVRMRNYAADQANLASIADQLAGDVAGIGFGAAVVGVAAGQVRPATGARRGIHLQAGTGNAGTICIGQANTVTVANGVQLVAGQAFWLENYRGAIWAVATGAGQRLNWFEV